MTQEIETILNALNETLRLLKELITEICPKLYKKEIIKGKWSIHEHATHVAVGDVYGFQKKINGFGNQESSIFEPLSGDSFYTNCFTNLELFETIEKFFKIRNATIEMVYYLTDESWNKEAIHPEYKIYTPYVMLRHLLIRNHAHMYKIEDMGFGICHVK